MKRRKDLLRVSSYLLPFKVKYVNKKEKAEKEINSVIFTIKPAFCLQKINYPENYSLFIFQREWQESVRKSCKGTIKTGISEFRTLVSNGNFVNCSSPRIFPPSGGLKLRRDVD